MGESTVFRRPCQTGLGLTKKRFVPKQQDPSIGLKTLLEKKPISRPPEQRGGIEGRQVETAKVDESLDRAITCADSPPVIRTAFHNSSKVVEAVRQPEFSDVRQRNVPIRTEQPNCSRRRELVQNLQNVVAFNKRFGNDQLEW